MFRHPFFMLVLVLFLCINTASGLARTDPPGTPYEPPPPIEYKKAWVSCNNEWYQAKVPQMVPDNLANGRPLGQVTKFLYVTAFHCRQGTVIIYWDIRPGVCGDEYLVAIRCDDINRFWIYHEGVPVVTTEEALELFVVQYSPESEEEVEV